MSKIILRHRLILLLSILLLALLSGVLCLPKVSKSYDYISAIPKGSQAEVAYNFLQQKFPSQETYIVLGIKDSQLFASAHFQAFQQLITGLSNISGITSTLSIAQAIELLKDEEKQSFHAREIFRPPFNDSNLKQAQNTLTQYPLYKNLLYNSKTNCYLIVARIKRAVAFSKQRDQIVQEIEQITQDFQQQLSKLSKGSELQNYQVKLSGMPYIRAKISSIISQEMTWLILGSTLFLLLIIALAFRSWIQLLSVFSILALSLIFTFSSLVWFGYKVNILTAVIPSLIIIIGIPNCVYFFHKYHQAYAQNPDQNLAIDNMLKSMGIITFFCNLTSALGFFVFIFTSSQLLREFSLIASLNVLLLFVLSYILIPIFLSYAPKPKAKLNKLNSQILLSFIRRIHNFTLRAKTPIWLITLGIIIFSILGITRLSSNSYILDDLQNKHKLVQDLRFFEQNFSGVMPLEIIIDTKKKRGATQFAVLSAVDSLERALSNYNSLSTPLSMVEGLKFIRQAYYAGDPSFYAMPNAWDLGFLAPYLRSKPQEKTSGIDKLLASFVDSNKSTLRISLRIADIGQQKTQKLVQELQQIIPKYIDTANNKVYITGDSIAFLAGNQYLLSGLKESILWATLFIVLIMFYLFRSVRITLLSIIPNLVPIILSLGILGFLNIPMRPSLVIIFSITLGIAVDITIRIMMHYRNFITLYNSPRICMQKTLEETGASIIYTTLILIIGFCIFIPSSFDSIRYLGIITTFTLFTSTLSNLFLLPTLLDSFASNKGQNKGLESPKDCTNFASK